MNYVLHLHQNTPATNALLLVCDIYGLTPKIQFHSDGVDLKLNERRYTCPVLLRETSPPTIVCPISAISETLYNQWREQVSGTQPLVAPKRVRDYTTGNLDKVHFFGYRSGGKKLVHSALSSVTTLDTNWRQFCDKYLSSSSSSSSSHDTTATTATLSSNPMLTELPVEFLLMAHTLRKHRYVAWRYISIIDFLVFPYVHAFVNELQERLAEWVPVCVAPLGLLWRWFTEIQQRPELQHFRASAWRRTLPLIDIESWLLRVSGGRSLAALCDDVRHPKHVNLVTAKHTSWRATVAPSPSPERPSSTSKALSTATLLSDILITVRNKLTAATPSQCVRYADNSALGVPLDWTLLPSPCDPCQGQLPSARVHRKRQQVANIYRLLQHYLKDGDYIVDFCAGGGHLTIVLAYLFPRCHFTLIDRNDVSLTLAHRRLRMLKLENVEVRLADIQSVTTALKFDVGLALHACGMLSDVPCCLGSLQNFQQGMGINYPRSRHFRNAGVTVEEYMRLASKADDNHLSALSKQAMGLINLDRVLRAQEMDYQTCQFTLNPDTCSPKNDVICGSPKDSRRSFGKVFSSDNALIT
jgi:hypothetical protein